MAYCVLGALLALLPSIRADWWGLLVLGFLICLYAFLAKGDRTVERYTVGDNCYIVGFVYTLSIITLSLIFDTEAMLGNDDQPAKLHPLLRTIGIALGTSVVGMFCRFALTHGVEISEDAFDQAVSRTASAAVKLEGVVNGLGGTSAAVERSLNRTVAAIDTYTHSLEKESGRVGQSLSRAATELLQDYQRQVESTLQALSTSNAALARRMDEDWKAVVQPVRDALEAASKSIVGYATRMEAETQSVGDTLNRSVTRVVDDLNRQVAQVLQANRFDDVRGAMAEMVDRHRAAVETTQSMLTNALAELKSKIHDSVRSAEKAQELVSQLEKAEGSGTPERMRLAMDGFMRNLEGAADTLRAVTDQQSGSIDAIGTQLKRLREAGDTCDELMELLRKDVDAISELKEQYRKQFDQAARDALDETHKLYSRLIGGAAVALSGLDDLDAFARDLRTVANRIDNDGVATFPSPGASS